MTGKRKGNKQSSMLSFLKPKIPRLTEAGIRDAAAKVWLIKYSISANLIITLNKPARINLMK